MNTEYTKKGPSSYYILHNNIMTTSRFLGRMCFSWYITDSKTVVSDQGECVLKEVQYRQFYASMCSAC